MISNLGNHISQSTKLSTGTRPGEDLQGSICVSAPKESCKLTHQGLSETATQSSSQFVYHGSFSIETLGNVTAGCSSFQSDILEKQQTKVKKDSEFPKPTGVKNLRTRSANRLTSTRKTGKSASRNGRRMLSEQFHNLVEVVEVKDTMGETRAADPLEIEIGSNDEKILSATLQAFESGTLTPLIKEELRCTIQSRRLAQGKGELQVEFKSPPKKKTMSEDERKRAVKRRQQNREAAQRFRQKQKDTADYLTAKIKRLEKTSKVLVDDMKRLAQEKSCLRDMLKNHLLVCANHQQGKLVSSLNIEELLREDPPMTSAASISTFTTSVTSVSDELTTVSDGFTPEPTPSCPDTAESSGSVFFPDEMSEMAAMEGEYDTVTDNSPYSPDIYQNGSFDQTYSSHYSESSTTTETFLEENNCIDDIYCEGEVVIEAEDSMMDEAESRFIGQDHRLDSSSSAFVIELPDPAQFHSTSSHNDSSLSDSICDVRNSLSSVYSKVHDLADQTYTLEAYSEYQDVQDFLLMNNNGPAP